MVSIYVCYRFTEAVPVRCSVNKFCKIHIKTLLTTFSPNIFSLKDFSRSYDFFYEINVLK